MKTQKTPRSQNNIEMKNKARDVTLPDFKLLTQSYSNQNTMVLAQKQAPIYQWTEQRAQKWTHTWNWVSLKPNSLSCNLWPQSYANWTLINQSWMTKIAIVDNIINVLKLLLHIPSLTYKLRLFSRARWANRPPGHGPFDQIIINQTPKSTIKKCQRNVTWQWLTPASLFLL